MNSQARLRRKLLKSVVIGSGVLGASGVPMDKWLTPVIDAVVLPAHAQTTSSGRYFLLNPDYPVNGQAQTGVSAQLASAAAMPNSQSVAGKFAALLIPSANAATVASPFSARLEMYLERLAEDRYRLVLMMTAIENQLKLVLFGDGVLQAGNDTIHLALCDGDPKPFPVVLEAVSEDNASIIIAGDSFTLGADSSATAPLKQACSKA